jgi:hypothetical protein
MSKRVDYAAEFKLDNKRFRFTSSFTDSGRAQNFQNCIKSVRKLFTQIKELSTIDLTSDSKTLRRLVKRLNDAERSILVKEIFFRADFIEILHQANHKVWLRRLIGGSFTARSVIMAILNAVDLTIDLFELLRNVSIACRLLKPERVGDMYSSIGRICATAKAVASLNGKSGNELPEVTDFVRFLFDFDVFPVSYCGEIEALDEHRQTFYEILWHWFPRIVSSACY